MLVFTNKQPIYQQIADYYRGLILRGALKAEESLPSVREAALALNINPNTVQRAFALLAEEGIVVNYPKKGYYVAKSNADQSGVVEKALRQLIQEGHSFAEIRSILEKLEEGEHD